MVYCRKEAASQPVYCGECCVTPGSLPQCGHQCDVLCCGRALGLSDGTKNVKSNMASRRSKRAGEGEASAPK